MVCLLLLTGLLLGSATTTVVKTGKAVDMITHVPQKSKTTQRRVIKPRVVDIRARRVSAIEVRAKTLTTEGETDLEAVLNLQTKVGRGGRELAPNCPFHLRVQAKAQFHVSMNVLGLGLM